jgi:hypothetical protein
MMKKKTMVDKKIVLVEPVRVASQPAIKPTVPTATPPVVLNHLLNIIRKGS